DPLRDGGHPPMVACPRMVAMLGVIGGSGFYTFFGEGGDEPLARRADGGDEPLARRADGGDEPLARRADGGDEPLARRANGGDEPLAGRANGGDEPLERRANGGAQSITVNTPYGSPSGPITVGTVGEHEVAFLPRHGAHHQYAPHTVPYRANMWALRSLGVR